MLPPAAGAGFPVLLGDGMHPYERRGGVCCTSTVPQYCYFNGFMDFVAGLSWVKIPGYSIYCNSFLECENPN